MENASKALYMAAGVLIGMMILGVFVYLFRTGGNMSQKYDEKQLQNQLQLFNSKFENYYKNNNTIMDMISVTNLAFDINKENDYNPQKTVKITIQIEKYFLKIDPEKMLASEGTPDELKRNYLYKSHYFGTNSYWRQGQLCVYDLLEKNKNELHLEDSLMDTGDTLSKVNSNRVYKYLFECTEMKYDKDTGRVESMIFSLIKNPEYTNI